ncbi:RNA polymerase sigma factor [Streptomyces sp. JJ36]|uniref:RNA polymerase sigma factor n=1 Tax=Streptomyces sp. JJ36 TaxID=2736645 RepID=UPI001F24CDE1|nr:RNA polymerase sigma factor [Streptomyces sp. JJ36]MCF6521992.1 RNA polymerase sigma factor [Streptomyces sp. JJ36]
MRETTCVPAPGRDRQFGTAVGEARSPGEGWPGDGLEDVIHDALLIELSRNDPGCFAEFYDRRAPEIHRYAEFRLGPELVDDVVAETFLRGFRARHGYDAGRCAARPWLYGIAGRVIGGHRRREAVRYRALRSTSADPATRRLAGALGGLRRRDRDVLLLSDWAGLALPEVATALRVPVRRAQTALERAYHRLEGEPA